jgi:hypothetical protein
MSDNESSAYWAAARAPRYPHRALGRIQTAYNPPPPAEPEPEPSGIEAVFQMSQAQYAAARDSIMAEHGGGPRRSSEWMGGVDLPAPRTTGLTDDQMQALMPWRSLGTPPPAGRVLDSEHSRAARYAAGHTSLAVPNRSERD